MTDVANPTAVDRARVALDRHAWTEAYDLLAAEDAAERLSPAELALFAQAAWWTGRLPVTIDARERAYAAAVKANDLETAVETAILLGRDNVFRNAHNVAQAWLSRADRLLEGVPEGVGHGWLAATRSMYAAITGDEETALAEATRALDIARRIKDRNLEALALSEKGSALVTKGDVAEGLMLVDEATIAAVSGEIDPGTAGGVCCTTIEACTALGEWRRAAEWTEAQDRWCRREGINGYPGMCRVFRAGIKRRRGDWLESEAEARQAAIELEGYVPAAVGMAFYEVGEIRLRRGDLPAAEEALLRAHALGTDPEPALSLLRLAQGRVTEAVASIGRALDAPMKLPAWRATPDSGLHRIPLLDARVEIALAANDVETAAGAAAELESLAARYRNASAEAVAAAASGATAAAGGDHTSAIQHLQRAVELFASDDAPYEAALARLELAASFSAAGESRAAALEARVARTALERLGAALALRKADALLATLEASAEASSAAGPGAERITRTFVFTDIVDSTRIAELVGDEAWDELIRWHDQALRAIVDQHGGEVIKATGDGFFVAFDDPDRAIDTAIAIQRRLAEQRRSQGFAPAVRIGLHRAEASRSGLDYLGIGVNQAARIGAAAAGSEILVSSGTLTASRRSSLPLERRLLELKGISEPVEVAAIDWR
jgi:class 3 adenylate cyclase